MYPFSLNKLRLKLGLTLHRTIQTIGKAIMSPEKATEDTGLHSRL